jgi:hypothetical protein
MPVVMESALALIEYFLALPKNDPRVDLSGLRDPFADVLRP